MSEAGPDDLPVYPPGIQGARCQALVAGSLNMEVPCGEPAQNIMIVEVCEFFTAYYALCDTHEEARRAAQ